MFHVGSPIKSLPKNINVPEVALFSMAALD